jgi:hypothetical protein
LKRDSESVLPALKLVSDRGLLKKRRSRIIRKHHFMVRVEEQRIWHNECLRMCEDVLVDEDLESEGAREIKNRGNVGGYATSTQASRMRIGLERLKRAEDHEKAF